MINKCNCGCGGEIVEKPFHKRRGIPKYINGHHTKNGYLGKFWKGKKRSQEQKDNHSMIMKDKFKAGYIHPMLGKKRPDLSLRNKLNNKKGKEHPMYGKHHSENSKLMIGIGSRISRLKENRWKKENNPSWRGGTTLLKDKIRELNEYKEWRLKVYTRDNFDCVNCKKKCGGLHCHHIKPFSKIVKDYKLKTMEDVINCKEMWDISNGVTLCFDCHKNTDTYLKGCKI